MRQPRLSSYIFFKSRRLTSGVHGQVAQLSPLLPFSPSPPKNAKIKQHPINHFMHTQFPDSRDPLMVLTRANHSKFSVAEFMTDAVWGLSAV